MAGQRELDGLVGELHRGLDRLRKAHHACTEAGRKGGHMIEAALWERHQALVVVIEQYEAVERFMLKQLFE